jgi:phosphoribosylamine--glycine ligase
MIVLLVGSGGREHALAWKLARSRELTQLVIAPGNPGMAGLGDLRPVPAHDVEGLLELVRAGRPDLVVVGPEAPLERGLADRLAEMSVPCFGPTAAAARLETSKAFTKNFAARHGLPTAAYGVFTGVKAAEAWLAERAPPYVVKADGLAAGKGVVIAADRAEAIGAVREMLGGRFGAPGGQVVLEEFMAGQEASFFALSDGETAIPFGAAQDHKRAYDGDRGPNTGGMGTYSPAPVLTPELERAAFDRLVAPAVAGMAAEGASYRGVLYAGLMLGEGGPRLVEYNARFGDPECQVLMLRLESDLLPYLYAAATGALARMAAPNWSDRAAVCVVLAAEGYPEAPRTGSVIGGAEADFGPEVVVFHAGTRRGSDDALLAAGGRVLNVCALGADVAEARARAYAAVDRIDWPGGFHRRDIGWRAMRA